MSISRSRFSHDRSVELHLGSSPARGSENRIEATLVVATDGASRVRLQQLAWGVGVGWYAQRTLELGLDDAREIAGLLERAPGRAEQVAEAEAAQAALLGAGAVPIELTTVRAHHDARRTRPVRPAGPLDSAPRAPLAFRRRAGGADGDAVSG